MYWVTGYLSGYFSRTCKISHPNNYNIQYPTKVFNEKYPDVVFTHPTFGLENDVYKARISTQMIQLSFFDDRDDLYLVYTFENELPSEKCHVSNREQGIPSRHRLSVTVDGVELFSKKRGFILTKNGRQLQRDLPIHSTSTNNPLMGMRIDDSPVDATLPTQRYGSSTDRYACFTNGWTYSTKSGTIKLTGR